MNLTGSSTLVIAGVGLCVTALMIGVYLLIAPKPVRLPEERRRPGVPPSPTRLTQGADLATSIIDKILRHRGAASGVAALEQAGLKIALKDFALLVLAGALAAAALGFVLAGPLLGVLLGIAMPLVAKLYLTLLAGKRQRAFADQLEDSLQLMASSLRAGHSLLQAMNSVARESEEPTAGEFSRIINETRVGRPLGPALDEAAARMDSQDFLWIAQAIAINREIGGNLAEVLDRVGQTIRERNQIRRQVKALSAEGKLSAVVLLLLPFGITGFLSMSNPEYIGRFTESFMGYAMMAAAVVLLTIGAIWLRKVVSFKF